MAGFDISRVIQAYQAGAQLKQQHLDAEQRKEERELNQKILKHQIDRLKIQDQMDAREVAMQQAKLMQGQPAQEIGITTPQASAMPYPGQIGQGPTLGGERAAVEATLAPVMIPGVEEFGVPSAQIQPQSMQDLIRQQQAQQVFASRLKQQENQVTIPPLPGLGLTAPTTVPANVAPALITGTMTGQRQTAQQTATAEENRKNREATDARAVADRQARLNAAQIAASARLQASLQGGINQKTIIRADAKVREFLQLPAVKKYQEVAEIEDYVKAFPVDAANAADDYTLLVTLAKAVDPASVAREGEVKAASNSAQSILDSFQIRAESVLNRSRGLTTPARRAIIKAIESKISPNIKSYTNVRNTYKAIIGNLPGLSTQYAEDLLPQLSIPMDSVITPDGRTFVKQPNGKYTEQ